MGAMPARRLAFFSVGQGGEEMERSGEEMERSGEEMERSDYRLSPRPSVRFKLPLHLSTLSTSLPYSRAVVSDLRRRGEARP